MRKTTVWVGTPSLSVLTAIPYAALQTESGGSAALRFTDLCRANEDKIRALVTAQKEARARNMELLKSQGQGRDWPAFRNWERFRRELLKQAGIKDT